MKRQETDERVENRQEPGNRTLRQRLWVPATTLADIDRSERWGQKNPYAAAFADWMNDRWRPDAFVTINLPNEHHDTRKWHGLQRDPLFYLNLWTRAAESRVFGRMALKIRDPYRRIGWMLRREVAEGLTHYHGLVRFPPDRRWQHEAEGGDYNIGERCEHLCRALQAASTKTPQPFAQHFLDRHFGADIDVRPYDPVEHAPYLLKGLWNTVPDGITDESTWDSGLIILPHLPKRKARKRRTVYGTGTADTKRPDRVPCDAAGTHPAAPRCSQ